MNLLQKYQEAWQNIHLAAANPNLSVLELQVEIYNQISNLPSSCPCASYAFRLLAELCGMDPGVSWLSTIVTNYLSRFNNRGRISFFAHLHNLVNQKLRKGFYQIELPVMAQ